MATKVARGSFAEIFLGFAIGVFTLVSYLAAGFFVFFALGLNDNLFQSVLYKCRPFSWFGLYYPILAFYLPVLLVVPAFLMQISNLLCRRPARITTWPLPIGMVVSLAALAYFWVFERGQLQSHRYYSGDAIIQLYVSVSIAISVAMACSLAIFAASRFFNPRLRWLSPVPALACILGIWILIQTEGAFTGDGLLPKAFGWEYLGWNLLIVLVVVVANGLCERRLLGRLEDTLFLASAASWASAAGWAFMTIGSFAFGTRYVERNLDHQPTEIAIQAVLVLEVLAIAILTIVRRFTRKTGEAMPTKE